MSTFVFSTQNEVPLFGRWEAAFTAEGQPPPTTEFAIALIAPSGRRSLRLGFWDGGRVWRVRFMPNEEGQWRYHSVSRPVDEGLHRKHGTFICRRAGSRAQKSGSSVIVTPWQEGAEIPTSAGEPAAPISPEHSKEPASPEQSQLPTHELAIREFVGIEDNPFLLHGPLVVAPGGHHLAHSDGTPFFLMADTAWNGPLLASGAEWNAYLDDRASKNFSATMFIPMAPWLAAYGDAEDQIAYSAHPFFPINPHFFRRLDSYFDAVNEKGLLAIPVMLWAAMAGSVAGFNPGLALGEHQLIALARYLVARYGAHHVLWLLAGDGKYDGQNAQRWRRVGRTVFEGTDHAPVGLHPTGLHWPYDDFRAEGWLDLAVYQSSHSEGARTLHWIQQGPPSTGWRAVPPRPVINLEPCYEGMLPFHSKQRPFTREMVRRTIYWSLLCSPIAGVAYGAHGVWSWEPMERVPLNHAATGIAKPWHEAIRLPGSYDMRLVHELLKTMRWWDMRPDQDLLVEQPGTRNPAKFIAAARSATGDAAMFYLPLGGEVNIRIDRLLPDRPAIWFDPRSGARHSAEAFEPGKYRIPDEQDWLLVMG